MCTTKDNKNNLVTIYPCFLNIRNRDSRLVKRTRSELELNLSDDDDDDNNNNSNNNNDDYDDIDSDITLQPRVIDDDSHSETDDG